MTVACRVSSDIHRAGSPAPSKRGLSAIPSGQAIIPCAADQPVTAITAEQEIIAAFAIENFPAIAARNDAAGHFDSSDFFSFLGKREGHVAGRSAAKSGT